LAIDRHADAIDLGETILRNPETGFNEVKTAALVARRMVTGAAPRGLALTGVKGRLGRSSAGAAARFIGELDSLRTSEHPLANPPQGRRTAAVTAPRSPGCWAQRPDLPMRRSPNILPARSFFAVPAEEFIDVEERGARAKGEIEFMLGKPELVAKGHFDDVDMAMMIHTGSRDAVKTRAVLASRRMARWSNDPFLGRAAHAGSFLSSGSARSMR
jgi:metal-dependent amidase/aminoacylase/carboxypeptidase family protein